MSKSKKRQTAIPEPVEPEIDWNDIERQVRMLSLAGDDGVRLEASPEDILKAANHLAAHYRKADKPLPDTLAALV
jgi:hypothetical protein